MSVVEGGLSARRAFLFEAMTLWARKTAAALPIGAMTIAFAILAAVFLSKLSLGPVVQQLIPPDSNLLIITIDTLRADRLAPYGHDRAQTPVASRLAREGVLFEWAFTPAPLTLPAHTSLFTGLLPFAHGVRDNGSVQVGDRHRTLAEVFAREGYATGGFVGAFVLDARWGISRGFDEYFDDFIVPTAERVAIAAIQRPASEVWAEGRRWLQANANRKFFLWLHFFDPHSPYSPPEPFASDLADDPYDGEVAYVDSVIGQVLTELEQKNLLERTVIILLSDHGEGLGQHGESEHGLLTYDSTLRIPWIMRLPNLRAAGSEIVLPVSLVDVFPTVVDLFEFRTDGVVDGRSRAGQLRDPASGRLGVVYAESLYPRLHFGWNELATVRTERFKYIRAPRPELYDYVADPGETRNVASERVGLVTDMEQVLDELTAGRSADVIVSSRDEATQERLRALGYIGGSPAIRPSRAGTALPDPKDKIATFEKLIQARRLLHEGRQSDAVDMLDALLELEPSMVQAHQSLREYYIEYGHFETAASRFRSGLARHDHKTPWLLSLGTVYRAWKRPEEALEAYRQALALEPMEVDALLAAAELERDRGNYDQALDYLSRAKVATSDTVRIDVQIAQTRLRQGRLGEAERMLRQVSAEHPRTPEAHYLLAVIAEQRGDPLGAEDAYRHEIKVNSSNFRARFNLALLLGQRGAYPEQIALLDSIPRIAPGFHEVHFYRAKAYLDVGDPARLPDAVTAAQQGLRNAATSQSAPLGHYVLADVYARQGRKAESRRELLRGRALEAQLRGLRQP